MGASLLPIVIGTPVASQLSGSWSNSGNVVSFFIAFKVFNWGGANRAPFRKSSFLRLAGAQFGYKDIPPQTPQRLVQVYVRILITSLLQSQHFSTMLCWLASALSLRSCGVSPPSSADATAGPTRTPHIVRINSGQCRAFEANPLASLVRRAPSSLFDSVNSASFASQHGRPRA